MCLNDVFRQLSSLTDALYKLHVGVPVELADDIILEASMTTSALLDALCLAPYTRLLHCVAHLAHIVRPVMSLLVIVLFTAPLADVQGDTLGMLFIQLQELPFACWINFSENVLRTIVAVFYLLQLSFI